MVLREKLKNGTKVIMEPMESFRSVSIGIWVLAGSIYETGADSGVSHFIEHMLFKGTETRSAADIASQMDSIGASINAFTAKECTCYYVKALGDYLDRAVDVLCDLVNNASLDPVELEKEKGVVIEEIAMVEDTPEDLVHEKLSSLIYGSSPLASPILGTQKTVSAFTRGDLVAYMDKRYTPENMVVACAGNFDRDKLIALLEEKLGKSRENAEVQTPESKLLTENAFASIEKDIEQIHMCIGFPGFALDTKEQYTLLVLNNAFGGSMSSRLFQRIREEKGLAYSVYSYPSSYGKSGYFTLYAGTGSSQAYDVASLMLEEVDKVVANSITREEFLRSKEQLKGGYMLAQESTSARSNSIGKAELLHGKVYTEDEILSRIESVSEEDVRAVISQVFDRKRMAASLVGRTGKDGEKIFNLLKGE